MMELSDKRLREEELWKCLKNESFKKDSEITELDRQLKDNRINYDKVCNENNELKLKILELDELVKSNNKIIDENNQKLLTNNIAFNVSIERIKTLEKERSESMTKIQEITEEIRSLKQDFDNFKTKYNRINNDNYDLKLEILELKDLVNSHNKTIDQKNGQLAENEISLNVHKQKIMILETEKSNALTKLGVITENLTKELLEKQNINYLQTIRINELTECLEKQESIINLLNTEKHNLNKTITENKTEMEVLSKEMAEMKNKIKDITLKVEEYKTKYEEYISHNQKLTENNDKLRVDCEELKTTLDKFREKLKRMQNDSNRKGKAIAVYIKNNDKIKNNLLRDNSLLESEVKQLKTDLNDRNILCEKLESELNSIRKEKEMFYQQMIDEKNQLRFECQKVVDTNKEDKDKLLKRNSQLIKRIKAAKEAEIGIKKLQIARFKLIIQGKERRRVKELRCLKLKETKLKSEIKSLKNRLYFMKRKADLNKSESSSNKYKEIASKSIYSKAIENLNKYSLQNNEEIFTAIIKVMDKMRVNSNQRLSDKNTKTLNDIKTKNISIEKSAKRISELRNDSRINCGLCSENYGSKGFLELHMKTFHSICFDEQEKEDTYSNNSIEITESSYINQ